MSVYNAAIRQLDWLKEHGYLTDANEALGELALNLAATLDRGAGLAQAAVANQFRATMQEIAKSKGDEDDEFEQFLTGLGTPGTSPLGNS